MLSCLTHFFWESSAPLWKRTAPPLVSFLRVSPLTLFHLSGSVHASPALPASSNIQSRGIWEMFPSWQMPHPLCKDQLIAACIYRNEGVTCALLHTSALFIKLLPYFKELLSLKTSFSAFTRLLYFIWQTVYSEFSFGLLRSANTLHSKRMHFIYKEG